jgi:hypothetical protein
MHKKSIKLCGAANASPNGKFRIMQKNARKLKVHVAGKGSDFWRYTLELTKAILMPKIIMIFFNEIRI